MSAKLVFLFFCYICVVYGKDHVPVLIWNTKQAQGGVPAVSALQYINYGTFQAKYLEAFQPKNILLFLQDALSIEDLSSHASEFRHVNQWMEKSHSLYLPNVENAAHLAHDLPSHGYSMVVLEPGIPSAGLDLKQEENNLVVVKLPSTLTNPSRSRALQKADEVMENVISKIGEKREFTVIFTGLKPSVEDSIEQYEDRVRVSRSLKAAENEGLRGFHQAPCSLLYLRKDMTLMISGSPSSNVTIDESKATDVTGDCSKNRATVHIKYTDIDIAGIKYQKAYFTFSFKQENDLWYFESVESYTNVSTTYITLKRDIDGIPLNMSYSCAQKIVLVHNDSNGWIYDKLILHGIQMQPFVWDDDFGSAWDCIGFFTVPIWTSLLTTFLLVLILTYGMYMLSDIKTMDRFDDPKGQPIMVPTAAE